MIRKLFPGFTWKRMLLIILGAAIVSFGLYNIHQQCGVTEGGVLGTVLLIHHWFGLHACAGHQLLFAGPEGAGR